MKIYNTLTRDKQELIPMNGKTLKIYACGPTVYNFIHIGNARPLCVFDVLRRYLAYRGYDVIFAQNFTDIDDKLINKANEEGITVAEVAEKFIKEFYIDSNGLNIKEATIHPKATENIDEIISLIETLIEKDFAYVSNGDVYFSTLKFKEYGKLSRQPLDFLEENARVVASDEKRSQVDFALWKNAKPNEPFWATPWGNGRPGWHIECSAMARRHLGRTIDIHCGGQDLIFPHHENEIAQSECANDCSFANYWMHNGYVNVDSKKMSKSLGNFFTVRDVAHEYGYEPIRFLMINSHYRSPINYSTDIILQSKNSLDRLYNCRNNLLFAMENAVDADKDIEGVKETLLKRKEQFIEAMDDDLNTADAIAAVFELARDINTVTAPAAEPTKELCAFALALFDELCDVLGILYNTKVENIDSKIEKLNEDPNIARKNKNFAEADRIRDEIKSLGIVLEDTVQGVKWTWEEK